MKVVETSSAVWKTAVLTVVLHLHIQVGFSYFEVARRNNTLLFCDRAVIVTLSTTYRVLLPKQRVLKASWVNP